MKATEKLRIVEADRMRGNILIHFSNGTAVHYHAAFLWDVREHDGNVVIRDSEEEEEPLNLPDSD